MKKIICSLFLSLSLQLIAQDRIEFSRQCEKGRSITIAAVGDILLHTALQHKSSLEGGFSSLWENLIPAISNADVAYANLEGPTSINNPVVGPNLENPSPIWDAQCFKSEFKNALKKKDEQGKVSRSWPDGCYYSSYPLFNYHPSLNQDLKDSGFDIVSTANNHSLDRRAQGIDKTITALLDADLDFVGTKSIDKLKGQWIKRQNIKGFKLSWVSCTYGTNGLPDTEGQVLNCYSRLGQGIISDLIAKEVSEGRFVIMLPHWGDEYNPARSLELNINPNERQARVAQSWVDKGVKLILGNHSHAFKKMEKMYSASGDEALVVYSMGNFVSNQGEAGQRATGIVYVGLTENAIGDIFVNGVKLRPAYMANRYSRGENLELIPLKRNQSRAEMQYLKSVINHEHFVFEDTVITNDLCILEK